MDISKAALAEVRYTTCTTPPRKSGNEDYPIMKHHVSSIQANNNLSDSSQPFTKLSI